MKNSKLNRTVISILGVLFVPGLLANAGVPANGFGQDGGSSTNTATGSGGGQDASKDEVIDEFGTFEIAVEESGCRAAEPVARHAQQPDRNPCGAQGAARGAVAA